MPVDILRWLVFVVVWYTGAVMLRAAITGRRAQGAGGASTGVVLS
jgi:hypothetical protein